MTETFPNQEPFTSSVHDSAWEALAHPLDEHGGVAPHIPGTLSAREAYPDAKRDMEGWLNPNTVEVHKEENGPDGRGTN